MNWKQIKQLNQLYCDGTTSIEILKSPFVKRWEEMGYIETVNKKTVKKTSRYDPIYEKEYLNSYKLYKELLNNHGAFETNFSEQELHSLIQINHSKEELLIKEKSQKEIATLYFNDAKYLKKESKLYRTVLSILGLDYLSIDEHDQQYLTVLHCKIKQPNAIILCENINQLRKPRLNDIELWYAGGRNTAKLKYILEPVIPFYYLCDWDNRGIEIYQDIKKNIFPNIKILIPEKPIKLLDIKSEWKTNINFELFSSDAQHLLNNLIPNKWIEEESISSKFLRR